MITDTPPTGFTTKKTKTKKHVTLYKKKIIKLKEGRRVNNAFFLHFFAPFQYRKKTRKKHWQVKTGIAKKPQINDFYMQ